MPVPVALQTGGAQDCWGWSGARSHADKAPAMHVLFVLQCVLWPCKSGTPQKLGHAVAADSLGPNSSNQPPDHSTKWWHVVTNNKSTT